MKRWPLSVVNGMGRSVTKEQSRYVSGSVHRGGQNDDGNLVVLCADRHAGRHPTDQETVVDELRDPAAETGYAD